MSGLLEIAEVCYRVAKKETLSVILSYLYIQKLNALPMSGIYSAGF